MSEMGQTRSSRAVEATSAVLPRADILPRPSQVGNVPPKGDLVGSGFFATHAPYEEGSLKRLRKLRRELTLLSMAFLVRLPEL